jgi:hypothetical protein
MSLTSSLRRLPVVAKLVAGAGVALTPVLLPHGLVPENLTMIVSLATLLILLGVYVAAAFPERATRMKPYLVGGLVSSLLLLMLLQVRLVETVAP